uniref:HEXI1 protein n=1 Tax=Denticeps clupeoides TaxID=299321 RepID=A0AAY4CMR0_9TELE
MPLTIASDRLSRRPGRRFCVRCSFPVHDERPSGGRASPEGACPGPRPGKKKHRRRPSKNKRRWKPYFKLTWEEKRALDERETARASRLRAEMFAKGLPVAPYNTTQFLMEQHDRGEPDLNTEKDPASEDDVPEAAAAAEEEEEDCDGSGWGSDGIGRAGGSFLQRDFSETYERFHAESLQSLSKPELVQQYLELERSLSRLEEENNRLRRLEALQEELRRLRAENEELLREKRAGGEAE